MSASTLSHAGPPGSPFLGQGAALRRHLQHCRAARGRWFTPSLWAERAHHLVAPRFVTTLACAALVLAVCAGWA